MYIRCIRSFTSMAITQHMLLPQTASHQGQNNDCRSHHRDKPQTLVLPTMHSWTPDRREKVVQTSDRRGLVLWPSITVDSHTSQLTLQQTHSMGSRKLK